MKKETEKIRKEWLRRDKNLQDREEAYYKIYKFTKDQEDAGYDRAMARTYPVGSRSFISGYAQMSNSTK